MSAPEPGRDAVIAARLDPLAKECFPDNPDVAWSARGVVHHGAYSVVEAEPSPDEVGYPRFKLVLWFRPGAPPVVAGCYCLDAGRWTLLFTDPSAPADWKSLPV